MRKLMILMMALSSSSVMAMPLISCSNPATGASIVVMTYNGAFSYNMSQALLNALESQGGPAVEAQGSGGRWDSQGAYMLDLGNNGFLSLAQYPGTQNYMLSVFTQATGSENFMFNPGECNVAI